MKKLIAAMAALLGLSVGGVANAATIGLAEYETSGGVVNISAFNTTTGLGTLMLTVSGAGAKFAGLFVDHEIDEVTNTFFNENGATGGIAPAGLSWEIDEPGYVFGDIFTNFEAGTLDNGNAVPASTTDDVSMALGWDFSLLAGETATIKFFLTEAAPGGFYLQQLDPDSDASVYFSSSINISGGGGQPVPEPSTMLLLGAGLAGLGFFSRRRSNK